MTNKTRGLARERRPVVSLAVVFLAALGLVRPALAMINPGFTPVHLVKQSEVILLLEFKEVAKDGKAVAAVKKVLKGKDQPKELTLDLMAGALEAQGKAVIDTIKSPRVLSPVKPGAEGEAKAVSAAQALMFIGKYEEEGGEGKDGARAFLHMDGRDWQWIVLDAGRKAGEWDMDKQESHLLGTWAGGTDMLLRAIDYIQEDLDSADVPVTTTDKWAAPVSAGIVAGQVSGAYAVDLSGESAPPTLFIASDAGDRLFAFREGKMEDVTAARKLSSKSLASVWGSFSAGASGRLDLLSWDGKALSLHTQQADGSFAASAVEVGDALRGGCIGLAVGPCTSQKATVVANTPAMPVLITFEAGKASAKPLSEGEFAGGELGTVGKCLVSDFDGDGLVDVLQLAEKGSLLYKGKIDEAKSAAFAPATKCAIALGRGKSAACLGDYDADDAMDVFVAGAAGCAIWHNAGGGTFVESITWSGEVSYIAKGGGVDVATGDINNDGRQDLFIAYGKMAPQLFFNRGFRSFGHARSMDLADTRQLPAAEQGQQAACLADLTGDGAQDLVLVLADGSVQFLPHETKPAGMLAVRVVLAAGADRSPVRVTARLGNRPLGAWDVTATGSAFFGLVDAGRLKLSYGGWGEKPRAAEVLVIDKPVRFTIAKDK